MRENQSIGRAVAVLRQVSQDPEGVTASELARRTSLSRMTVARLAATLAQHRMLARKADHRYVLGPELARLGHLANHEQLLIAAFAPRMRELCDTFEEAVTLELPRADNRIETAHQVNPDRVMTPNWVGRRIDLHASAAGKVFLAFSTSVVIDEVLKGYRLAARTPHTITDRDTFVKHLDLVRRQGYAETREEYELELFGVSVPVLAPRTPTGLVAIISVTGPTARLDRKLNRAALRRIRRAAAELAARSESFT